MKKINHVNAAIDAVYDSGWIALNEGNLTAISGTITVLMDGIDGTLDGTLDVYISNDNDNNSGVKINSVTIDADPFELFINVMLPIQFIKFTITLNGITLIDNLEIDGIFEQEARD